MHHLVLHLLWPSQDNLGNMVMQMFNFFMLKKYLGILGNVPFWLSSPELDEKIDTNHVCTVNVKL